MTNHRSVRASAGISTILVAVLAQVLFGPAAMGQSSGRSGGRHGSGGGQRQSEKSESQGDAPAPSRPEVLTPHGGDYLSTATHRYEIVFMPLQTRVYLFDRNWKPTSARAVRGEMVLQFPTDSAPRHLPLQYQAVPPGVPEQDYVVAVVDIRELPDKETPISFEFADPSGPNKPNLSFNPVFTPSKIRPYVAKVLLTESDIDGINHQRICPVTGALLGSKGPIVKLYIADYPLYVSGPDCIAAVREAPQRYLPGGNPR